MRIFYLAALVISCPVFCAAQAPASGMIAPASGTIAPASGTIAPGGVPAAASPQAAADNRVAAPANYRLGPDDQIVIRATSVPDISDKPVRVDQNGFITLPMIGRVKAAGLTTDELNTEIVNRLKYYLVEPDVVVGMVEYRSQPVSVLGAVATPGVHQLEGEKTLVEILAMSGGVTLNAGPTVRITRRLEFGRIPLPGATDDASGKFSVAEVAIKPLIAAQTPQNDIEIKPYDIISVPKALLVYVAGDVARVGVLPLDDGPSMSIMEALSSSGGATKTSDLKRARIMRNVAGSTTREQLTVDINKIMSGKSGDVRLVAGDILFIPGSTAKKATQKALDVAVQAGTVLLTYGVAAGAL